MTNSSALSARQLLAEVTGMLTVKCVRDLKHYPDLRRSGLDRLVRYRLPVDFD